MPSSSIAAAWRKYCRAESISPNSMWISPSRVKAGNAASESGSRRLNARFARGTEPAMSPCWRMYDASASKTTGDAGGEGALEGLAATRFRADLSRFLDFLLLGFVFAILSSWRCWMGRGGEEELPLMRKRLAEIYFSLIVILPVKLAPIGFLLADPSPFS